jgi:hypothetical protein
LILARKDGSIIKATGFTSTQSMKEAQSTATPASDAPAQLHINGGEAPAAEHAHSDTSTAAQSPAEELAGSIFQFVQSASLLGTSLCTVSVDNDEDASTFRRVDPGESVAPEQRTKPDNGSRELQDESQIHLLRLRIKSREIIIFPDPLYLCCVVQRVGLQGQGLNTR